MSTNADDLVQMSIDFKKWDAEFAEIVTHVDLINTRTRAAQDAWMKELRASRDEAHARMREFAAVQGVAQEGLRPAAVAAQRVMEQTLAKVRDQLNLSPANK